MLIALLMQVARLFASRTQIRKLTIIVLGKLPSWSRNPKMWNLRGPLDWAYRLCQKI